MTTTDEKLPIVRRLMGAWRGSLGDDLISAAGLVALAFDVWGRPGFTPLSFAVFALFLVQKRRIDRGDS